MTKKIKLTQEQYTLVDDEDFDFLNQWKWFAIKTKSGFYAARNKRICEDLKRGHLLMHRAIMNPDKELFVDHIDGNTLNNRKTNLRIVTHRQNHQNRHSKVSSKYPGVSYDKAKNRWRPCIRINGKSIHLGTFKNEKRAFEVYKEAVHELTGEKVLGE